MTSPPAIQLLVVLLIVKSIHLLLQASWDADKVEEERKLEKVREQLERSKNSLLSEQRDHMELLYKERKEIAREKTRLATASQKATQKVAEGEQILQQLITSMIIQTYQNEICSKT